MKNTMYPSTATTTAATALALSLLQAPAMPSVQGADVAPASNSAHLSSAENALINGTAADALKLIDASALDNMRPEVIEKEMARVVEKVVKDLMLQGKVDDAQRVVRSVRDLFPQSVRVGTLRAFGSLDAESFAHFCDQSILYGAKPHHGLKRELHTTSDQLHLSPTKSAELLNVMDRVDASRAKVQIGMEIGAVCATGVAVAAGAASHRSVFTRTVQAVAGAAAAVTSSIVFSSLFGDSTSLMSFDGIGGSVSFLVAIIGGYQTIKGLFASDND